MKKEINANFTYLSFLPALAYWYLEANYPIKIAIMGGISLAVLEIILEYIFTKHIHFISKFNFLLLLVLGTLSFMGDEGLWFKLQPAITGVVIGVVLFVKNYLGKGVMLEMMESMGKKMIFPISFFRKLEFHISYLFFSYGLFMFYVALNLSTSKWVFFKTIGFYIAFFIFMVIEFFILKRNIKDS